MKRPFDIADLLVILLIVAMGDWLWAVLYADAIFVWWLLESLGQA